MGIKVKNFGMEMHVNMGKERILVKSGTIDHEGHELHGKTIVQRTNTVKKSGKYEATTAYFIRDFADAPEFDSLEKFKNHYKL